MGYFMKRPICSQQYAKGWMKKLGVENISEYSTHSIRKTKPSVIYSKTHNVNPVRELLGQSSVTTSSTYLGVSDNSALELEKTITIKGSYVEGYKRTVGDIISMRIYLCGFICSTNYWVSSYPIHSINNQ